VQRHRVLDAGVVDQDIDATVRPGVEVGHHRRDRVGIAQVGAKVAGAAVARGIDGGDRRRDLLRRAQPVDRNLAAGRGQRSGDREADAGGAAGHQCGAALQESVSVGGVVHRGSMSPCASGIR